MRTMLIATMLTTLILGSTATLANSSAHGRLLFHTGVERQAAALPAMIEAAAADNRARCSLSDDSATTRAMPHFSAQSLLTDTRTRLKMRLSVQQANRLLRWYQSDLGRRIANLERQDPATMPVANATRTLLDELSSRKNAARDPRARALLAIVEHTQVARYTAAIGTEIEYAGVVSSGCAQRYSSTSAEYRYELALADAIRANQSLLRQIVQFEAPMDMARLFQSLSDSELQSYREFAESDDARQFSEALISAFTQSFEAASERAMLDMQAPVPTASNE